MSELEWKNLASNFNSLKQKIPGITELSIGKNITPERGGGYTHALRVLFTDEIALRAYGPHLEHEAFKKLLPHDLVEEKNVTICVDWEREE